MVFNLTAPPIEAKQVFLSSYRGREWVYTSIWTDRKPGTVTGLAYERRCRAIPTARFASNLAVTIIAKRPLVIYGALFETRPSADCECSLTLIEAVYVYLYVRTANSYKVTSNNIQAEMETRGVFTCPCPQQAQSPSLNATVAWLVSLFGGSLVLLEQESRRQCTQPYSLQGTVA